MSKPRKPRPSRGGLPPRNELHLQDVVALAGSPDLGHQPLAGGVDLAEVVLAGPFADFALGGEDAVAAVGDVLDGFDLDRRHGGRRVLGGRGRDGQKEQAGDDGLGGHG